MYQYGNDVYNFDTFLFQVMNAYVLVIWIVKANLSKEATDPFHSLVYTHVSNCS